MKLKTVFDVACAVAGAVMFLLGELSEDSAVAEARQVVDQYARCLRAQELGERT